MSMGGAEADLPGVRIQASAQRGRSRVVTIKIQPGCPYFDGHFPGHPVLPAIAYLDIASRLYRQLDTPSARISEVMNLRLSRQVAPGETLTFSMQARDSSGACRFEVARGEDRVCRGTIRWRVEE